MTKEQIEDAADKASINLREENYRDGFIDGANWHKENNSSWIKIESEDDLPEENGTYFVIGKTYWKPFYRIDVFTGRLKNSFDNGKSCFTHYQQIEKPKPPIY